MLALNLGPDLSPKFCAYFATVTDCVRHELRHKQGEVVSQKSGTSTLTCSCEQPNISGNAGISIPGWADRLPLPHPRKIRRRRYEVGVSNAVSVNVVCSLAQALSLTSK
jgi:hypothetical protein